MVRFFIFLTLLFAMTFPGTAQNFSPESRMEYFREAEERLLRLRDGYKRQEASFSDPIWLRGEDESIHIVDGARLRDRAESWIFIAQALGFEQAMLDTIPPELRIMAEFLGEGGRAELAADKMMEGYRTLSRRNRQDVLEAIEGMLDRSREEFFAAKQERDAKRAGSTQRQVSERSQDVQTVGRCGAIGSTFGTSGPVQGKYGHQYCKQRGFERGAQWKDASSGWTCVHANNTWGPSVDQVAVCQAALGDKVKGVCYTPEPGDAYYLYNPICVISR